MGLGGQGDVMRGKARIPAADEKIRENRLLSVRFVTLPSGDWGERVSSESDESPS